MIRTQWKRFEVHNAQELGVLQAMLWVSKQNDFSCELLEKYT